MSRSTTSLASSYTVTDMDRPERSHRVDVSRIEELEKRITDLENEKRTASNNVPSSPSRSTPTTSSSSPDRGSPDLDAKKKKKSRGLPSPTSGPPAGGPQGPDDLYRPKTLKFWLILVANFLAMFLVALDRTIVATAIPQITDDFHSLGDIGWYGSAYMLTTAASQLVFGRLYKYYNMKW